MKILLITFWKEENIFIELKIIKVKVKTHGPWPLEPPQLGNAQAVISQERWAKQVKPYLSTEQCF